MKRIILYFIISFVISIQFALPQTNEVLYLINGHPKKNIMVNFPVGLNKFDFRNKQLINVADLVPNTIETKFIRAYHSERIVSILTKDYRQKDLFSIIISMDDPGNVRIVKLNYPKNHSYIKANMFKLGKGLVQGFELYCLEPKSKLVYGVNIDNSSQIVEKDSIYTNTIVSGESGGAVDGGDYLLFYCDKEGRLEIPIALDITRRPKLDDRYILPENFRLQKKDRGIIKINNDKILVASTKDSYTERKAGDGFTNILIFNKQSNQWKQKKIKGISTYIMGFDNWMSLVVTEKNYEKVINTKGREERKKLQRISPGKENRRSKLAKTGTAIDHRFDDYGIYRPGKIMLYNVETDKEYFLETNEGDSEVLLIHGDKLIYRINDCIYQSTILKDTISKPELLVKDEIVYDIHWAFFK